MLYLLALWKRTKIFLNEDIEELFGVEIGVVRHPCFVVQFDREKVNSVDLATCICCRERTVFGCAVAVLHCLDGSVVSDAGW